MPSLDTSLDTNTIKRNYQTSAPEAPGAAFSRDYYNAAGLPVFQLGANADELPVGWLNPTTKSADYTVTLADRNKFFDVSASGAARTITLPAVATVLTGFLIVVGKSDSSSNAVTVDGDGSETISGATTYALTKQYQTVTLLCNGAAWVALTPTLASLLTMLGVTLHQTNPGGRLTLTTAVPVTTSDVTAAGTLYYTPYLHNKIALYSGSVWALHTFTERSLALTLTSGKNYDVFIYDNAGTLTLELSAAWTNDTTRADALTTQDGVTVKSGATTRLWLGTIRASGTNTTEDSKAKRFVWNAYNRVTRKLEKLETTSSWTYNAITWQSVNAADTNRVEVVTGALADETHAFADASTSGATGTAIAIGLDSTTAPSSGIVGYRGGGAHALSQGFYADTVFGYHYFQALERCQDTTTYTSYGQFTATTILIQTGVHGSTRA